MIENPVLRGFHPDPSILRVGRDYFIATSTFEWFPGVAIYHSRDLVHWQLVARPLDRLSLLDLKGNINSGGVWAPCLSYSNGLFYLVYTDVKSRTGAFKDTHNYLTTAKDVTGPWSEPVYLNSSGFDPSLFHDDDGTKWLVNMLWDFRQGKHSFAGIVMQQYSEKEQKLIGPVENIFTGTSLRMTEGPHLYKRGGYYYLLTAEGGTGYEHAVTMARAKKRNGPYTVDPENPILTSVGFPDAPLQKAGHASLVETESGEWYLAHLCGRPVKGRYCILGRETALQRCYWTDDGWLRVEGGPAPSVKVPAPQLPEHAVCPPPEKDDFQEPTLAPVWNTLRIPPDESWLTLTERRGYLRLRGMESPSSLHSQSLVARRLQSFHCTVETTVDFEPETFQQMAGLMIYYDTNDFLYLRITLQEEVGKCLGVIRMKHGQYDEPLAAEIPLTSGEEVQLRADIDKDQLQFFYAATQGKWRKVGEPFDLTHLSDDDAQNLRFTGIFVGMAAHDLSGKKKEADFDSFAYREREVRD